MMLPKITIKFHKLRIQKNKKQKTTQSHFCLDFSFFSAHHHIDIDIEQHRRNNNHQRLSRLRSTFMIVYKVDNINRLVINRRQRLAKIEDFLYKFFNYDQRYNDQQHHVSQTNLDVA